MFKFMIILCCSLVINTQRLLDDAHPPHKPYAFGYIALNEDGSSHSREEKGDANGRVTGFYTLQDPLTGSQRRVEYVADENGFRATVSTNEIGTESQNAADAQYISSAPTAAELVARYAASDAGKVRLAAPAVIAPQQMRALARVMAFEEMRALARVMTPEEMRDLAHVMTPEQMRALARVMAPEQMRVLARRARAIRINDMINEVARNCPMNGSISRFQARMCGLIGGGISGAR